MREILFKGKRKDTGEWVEGYYMEIEYCDGKGMRPYIKTHGCSPFEIDPTTLGQFTGKKSIEGKLAFEHDKVIHPIYLEGIIKWDTHLAQFYIDFGRDCGMNMIEIGECEIIGNIHDKEERE